MKRLRLGIAYCLTAAVLFPSMLGARTRFVDPQGHAIDEIRIEGNREITAYEIRNMLELGPDDIRRAVQVMRSVLPYFETVDWQIEEEEERRVLTLRVREYASYGRDLTVAGAFNRVHGFRLGPRLEVWHRPRLRTPPRGRLFGELTYGVSNGRWNYEFGATGARKTAWAGELRATAQFYRLTETRDPDVLMNDAEQFFLALAYGGDFRTYYEREGAEIALQWQTDSHIHTLKGRFLSERHRSLATATNWSLFRPASPKEPNPPITPGEVRSVVVRYDLDLRSAPVFTTGWYHSLEVERSFGSGSSALVFTRLLLNLRRYQRVGDDFIHARLRWALATAGLPAQRRPLLGGPGTLRGYELGEFSADRSVLFNLEYRRHLFGGSFLLFFYDAGRAWGGDKAFGAAVTRTSVGIGLLLENAVRIRVARALESNRKATTLVRWARTF